MRHRLKLRQILSEKWKEALQAVLPIITIVLALSFTIAPLSPSVLLCFLMGAVLILVGMMFFTTGAETAIAAALTAAGVTDAEIVAAAPEETGALAILPAVFKAYETLTCQPLDPEAKETAAAALREADALSGELDTSKLEELLGAMTDFFDELAALSDDELRERIRSIAAEHGMTLNDAQTQQLADLFRKIQSLGGSNFAERMQDLPGTVEKIRESGESALSTAGTVWDSIRGFFQRVGKTLSAIFGG